MKSAKNYLEILNEIVAKFREDRQSIALTWNFPEKHEIENQRQDFINKYSKEKIEKLDLDHFIDGKRDEDGNKIGNNFCHDLGKVEFGSLQSPMGMRIFGIYREKESQNIWYDPKVGNSIEDVFKKIKKAVVRTIELGRELKFKEIEELKEINTKFQSKILAVYFPENMLSITNKEVLSKIALDFELFSKKEIKKKSLFDIQQSLLKFKKSQENLQSLNNLEYSHVLWYYNFGLGKDLKPTNEASNSDTMNLTPFEKALEWKPNLILYGPPGTGKTYFANEIAKKITANQKTSNKKEFLKNFILNYALTANLS